MIFDISPVSKEPFDYTEWQRNLYSDMTVEKIGEEAGDYWEKTHKK
jgi:hypothetical protein